MPTRYLYPRGYGLHRGSLPVYAVLLVARRWSGFGAVSQNPRLYGRDGKQAQRQKDARHGYAVTHLWVHAELRDSKTRTDLAPEGATKLIAAGPKMTSLCLARA